MKASELRIGNIVSSYRKVHKICASDFEVLVLYENRNEEPPYRPIPLTEELLLKFGFELQKGEISQDSGVQLFNDSYKKGNFRLNLWYDGKMFYWENKDDTEIKYVHQLQNLYFALTGTELTIK